MGRFYLPAGTAVARYELIRPIGSGGSGVVYEAFDATLSRRVAVKVRAPELTRGSREASERSDQYALGVVVLLPSSSPPDAQTTVECMRRMHRLQSSMRRQATVAVGGGIWQSVIRHVFSAMMLPRGGRFTLSGTIEEGIARLLEKRTAETPSFRELCDEVLALYEALELEAPEIDCGSSLGLCS